MFRRRSGLRDRGFPPGGNGASSFHLAWRLPPGAGHFVEAAVTLEIVRPPAVDHLHFWALQVGFPGAGAAHLGLQWNRGFPGFGAANWGGYAANGGLLDGTDSPLPSTPGDTNTRDYPWVPGRPYRLRITRSGPGAWRGDVTDLELGTTTVVRDLFADSEFLADPIVWSEVFARCDDPSVTARWSDFSVVDERGESVRPTVLAVNYQSLENGGCSNTTSVLDGDHAAVLQVTNAERTTPQDSSLTLARDG